MWNRNFRMVEAEEATANFPQGAAVSQSGRILLFAGTVAVFLLAQSTPAAAQSATELSGAWAADEYFMAEGGVHEVQGRIFFSERDWQVLFFVMDESGDVRRGSGEGGSYTVDDGELVFTHLFNLSVGEEMLGLPAAELQMVSRPPEGAPLEPTNIDIEGDLLTLHFPSSNRMTFRRR
ncbi:MAG: hypothetical protein ACKVIN_01770 [Longimicrobiales bacterium]|jgi:hypothetical protein